MDKPETPPFSNPALAGEGGPASEAHYLGVLGTMIWDRICGVGDGADPVEEWGGISYSLEALSVALPPGWAIRPIQRLGEDLAHEALAYLSSIPGVESWSGIQVTPGVQPRVELRYQDQKARVEVPSGGVPPWTWAELEPLLEGLDALYVNFITGRELDLTTARALGAGFPGPIYADLHTLFAATSASGIRYQRPLPFLEEWLRAFDLVQLNEDEFGLIAESTEDAWERAGEMVGGRPALIAVTLGSRGSAYLAREGFPSDLMSWSSRPSSVPEGFSTRIGRVPAPKGNFSTDPTGCGDVWGATFFARLLAGEGTEEAMASANRLAFENLGHRGARGLHRILPAFSTGP
jgi:hypothetical protein